MNREIKFRAWDGEQMHILKNSGLQYYDFEGSYSLGFTVDGYSEFWAHEQYKTPTERAKEFPIMQFTGLKDRNGTEIYEGDIIQINHPFRRRKYTGKVFFSDGQFNGEGFYFSHYDTPNNCFSEGLEYIEVIGNIYQNPELLNNK